MKEIIKKREIKGIFISALLIVLGIFLMMKPEEIVNTLIKIMGIILILCGALDSLSYFKNKEDRILNYNLLKGLMELSIGILFIFKFEELTSIFTIIIGLIIIFINVSKLQLSLNLKELGSENWIAGMIISSLSIILGIVIILDPINSVEILIIMSGAILIVSEISNIIYSILVLTKINKLDKNIKDIIVKEVKSKE